jgi:hypothetical protein
MAFIRERSASQSDMTDPLLSRSKTISGVERQIW